MAAFDVLRFEELLGEPLPRDPARTPLVEGKKRQTPYGDLFNVSVRVVDSKGFVKTKGWGDDGQTYEKYPELYDLVPRICVVSVGEDGAYAKAAFALPKFNALTRVDDDDGEDGGEDEHESERGRGREREPVNPPDSAKTALHTPGVVNYFLQSKENGHTVAIRLLPATNLLLAGTKGCAWLCPITKEGLLTDDALANCKAPTDMVMDAFRSMQAMLSGPDGASVLAELWKGRVLVGEQRTNQHIRYHTPEERGIVFFDTDTPPAFRRPEVLGPFTAEDLTPAMLHGLRGGGNTEGWVLCGMSAAGTILIRFKLKTVSYTCLRTARESFNPDDGLPATLQKWYTRVHARNQFLQVDPAYLDEVVFRGFLAPLAEFMYATGVTRHDISFRNTGFAPTIHAFRLASGRTDNFRLPPPCTNTELLRYRALQAAYVEERAAKSKAEYESDRPGGGVLVMTSAMPPGTGKTVAMTLAAAGVPGAVNMSQDQFSPRTDVFYDTLEKQLRAGKVVFLHRCCFDKNDRRRVLGIAAGCRASAVVLEAAGDAPVVQLYTALRGVLLREKHETLGVGVPDATRAVVAGSFWCQSSPINLRVECAAAHWRENAVVFPLQMHVHGAVEGLPVDLREAVEGFGREMRTRKPFDTKTPLSDAAVYADLFKRIREGPELRNPAQDVAEKVTAACLQYLEKKAGSSDRHDAAAAGMDSCVIYASLDLAPEDTKRLLAALSYGPFRGKAMATSADHVTLVYKPSEKQVAGLSRFLGTRVRVRVGSYVAAADGGIVACEAAILDAGELEEFLPVFPHITIAWAQGYYRPVDSLSRLFGESSGEVVKTDLDVVIDLIGTVKFYY